MLRFTVSLPGRLDVFLSHMGSYSRGRAQVLIENGNVSVNGTVRLKPSICVQEGDIVDVLDDQPVAQDPSSVVPSDLHLRVLYEDVACMVISKPAGIAVHPGAGMLPNERTILDGAAFLFKERSLPFSTECVLVHRLDRETTGCLLLAKNAKAHTELQKQFETRTVEKKYLAIVAGVPNPPSAMIDAPVGRSSTNRTKMAVLGASATRNALTTYETLSTSQYTSLLVCTLHTGRTHQIRIHLSTIGHPILGDAKYSSEVGERLATEYEIHDLCLHAWKLKFVSPEDGKVKAVKAGVPEVMMKVMERLDLDL